MADSAGYSEFDFGRLLVTHGLVKQDQIEECLGIRDELATKGVQPLPGLGEILVTKGYLTPGQLERTIRIEGQSPKSATKTPRLIPAPAAPSGERFGKYVKTEKLGEGGMGVVWKAWDTELGRWTAIKFLKSRDEEEIARFQREAQLAAKLSHPNIAAVYEAQEDYICMQYVRGQTLLTYPRDDLKKQIGIICKVAEAVHYAHGQGVIHRDLKPANFPPSAPFPAFPPLRWRSGRTRFR